MLKVWNVININSTTDALIITCRKIFHTNILLTPADSCLNGWVMLRKLTDLNFKWSGMIKMMSSLLAREISLLKFKNCVISTCWYTFWTPIQASKMDPLVTMDSSFKLTLLNIFAESLIMDVGWVLNIPDLF